MVCSRDYFGAWGAAACLKTWCSGRLSLSDWTEVDERSDIAAVFLRRIVVLIFFLAGLGFGGGWVCAEDSLEKVLSESLTTEMSFLLVLFCFCVVSCWTLMSFRFQQTQRQEPWVYEQPHFQHQS